VSKNDVGKFKDVKVGQTSRTGLSACHEKGGLGCMFEPGSLPNPLHLACQSVGLQSGPTRYNPPTHFT